MGRFCKSGIFIAAALFWLGIASLPAVAQNFDAGVSYLVGLPQNDFRENVNRNGYGLSGHFGYFLGKTPIMIGADLGFINYGTEKRREPFSNTIPDVTVDVRTANNILMLHGFARLQQQQGAVRPYVEGLWGFKYLFTRTSIANGSVDMATAASTNFGDWARSWGGGAGVDFRIWKPRQMLSNEDRHEVTLNLSARYLWGSEADYLKKGSIQRNQDGTVTYQALRSRTDMLIPQIGLRFHF